MSDYRLVSTWKGTPIDENMSREALLEFAKWACEQLEQHRRRDFARLDESEARMRAHGSLWGNMADIYDRYSKVVP